LVNKIGPLLESISPWFVYSGEQNGISLEREKNRISENHVAPLLKPVLVDSIFLGIQSMHKQEPNISVNITFSFTSSV